MNTKTTIAGILAGITYFLLGWLIYGVLLKDSMEDAMGGGATGVMRAQEEFVWWALVVGNMGFGFAMAYILGSWSGVTTFMGGLKAGATVAILFALGYDLIFFATTNVMTLNGVFMDVAISTIMGGIAGGVIGWWMGRP